MCGFPLPKRDNIIEDSDTELCLASKRTCSMHFRWEKLRRAQIDLEKLRTVRDLNLHRHQTTDKTRLENN